MEKYGTARQATDDNIIGRMRFACWINKATGTLAQYVAFIGFPRQLNAPPYYVIPDEYCTST